MKKLLALSLLLFAISCNEPAQVTTRSDQHTATSGTLGSENAENRLPNATRDSTTRTDTVVGKRDSL